MSMLEAECGKCGETFVPHGTTEEDLIHLYSEAQDQDCGGTGVILGEYIPTLQEWADAKAKGEEKPKLKRKPNPQHNIEDKTFKVLIKRYTKERDWGFVQRLFQDYGRVLEDRMN